VTKFGIGQPVPRLEDPRFITGRGRFVDDIQLPRQCHGVVVMSPHAHARIKRVDTARANAVDGVLAVLTGADVEADRIGALVPVMPEDMGGPKGFRTLRPILCTSRVRAVGDRVAFVVAETAQARAADGVLAVLTGADVEADKLGALVPVMPEDIGGPKGLRTLRPLLCTGRVRAVGDRVAFVVAETAQQARDAAELMWPRWSRYRRAPSFPHG